MKKQGKKYIEFLLHNEDHLKEIERLEALHDEIGKELRNGNEKRIKQQPLLIKKTKKLIESNYYYDPEIDVAGNIKLAWEDLITWENPHGPIEIVQAIENEIEKRPKRKRNYPVMWEKLEAMGLAERTKKSPSESI